MIYLQPCTINDLPDILSMRKDFYAIDQYTFNHEEQERLTNNFILDPYLGILWIIIKDDLIIGYTCLTYGFSFEYGGKTAFIDELYLKAAHRNKGYGNQIMEYIITVATELNISTLHLEAEKHNDSANQLYLKKGFMNTDRNLLYNRLSKE